MIGSFLGRLMLAVDHDGTGSEGTILLERGFGVDGGKRDSRGKRDRSAIGNMGKQKTRLT